MDRVWYSTCFFANHRKGNDASTDVTSEFKQAIASRPVFEPVFPSTASTADREAARLRNLTCSGATTAFETMGR
jgi:hypothetical protein